MICCNPRVYIESGNGSVELGIASTEEGFGVLLLNQSEPGEIGRELPMREDFDPTNTAITWLFKNTASLNVVIEKLIALRVQMENFDGHKEETHEKN